MATASRGSSRHELSLLLFGLPASATVRLDLPSGSGASIAMLPWAPAVQVGAGYGGQSMLLRSFSLQPRRLQFEVDNPPPELPVTVQVDSTQRFLFGWLQVPDNVQTAIATAAQRLRIVGATYWAVPVTPAQAVQPSADAGAKPSG